MSRATDWPTDSDESSYAAAARRGQAIGGVLVALLVAGALSALLVWGVSRPAKHPGGTPALVAHRSRLPSCGAYKALPAVPGAPPRAPTTPQQVSVDHCIIAAYQAGRQAEATVAEPPDDTGSVLVLYYRVLGPGDAQVVIEQIPKVGRIEAWVSSCRSITTVNGDLTCS